jgi:hypothetical protein
MKAIIYKITCKVNEKVYIGFTTRDIETRFKEHIKESRNKKDLRKFYCAIRKYGEKNFCIESIYETHDCIYAYETMEDYFIKEHNSITSGYNTKPGGIGQPGGNRTKPVSLYDSNKRCIVSFQSYADAARFIGVAPARISSALRNFNQGRASRVKEFWVSPSAKQTPFYKKENNLPAVLAAREVNTGKKRPRHSKFLKENSRRSNQKVHVPEGWMILTDAAKIYGIDLVREWCRNSEKVITKMMILKSKKINDYSLVGKTRREAGFYYED